jgi:transposase
MDTTSHACLVFQPIEMVWASIKKDVKRRFSIHRDAPIATLPY